MRRNMGVCENAVPLLDLIPDGLNGVGACHSHCDGLARHGDPDRDVHLVNMGLDTQAGSNWFEPKGLRIAMAVHISYS